VNSVVGCAAAVPWLEIAKTLSFFAFFCFIAWLALGKKG
jgi:hypothetical protein